MLQAYASHNLLQNVETVNSVKEELNINSVRTQAINGATGNRLPPNMPWMEH